MQAVLKHPEPMTEAEKAKVSLPAQPWNDTFALKVAVEDFEHAERYRQMVHDKRYRNADELYLAWVQQRFWDGTKMPRSSLGVFLCFQQIESVLPIELASIFSDPEWFSADPDGLTTYEEAEATKLLMLRQLKAARVRQVFKRALKDSKIYGNGVFEVGWDMRELTRRTIIRNRVPIRGRKQDPLFGSFSTTVGMKSVYEEKVYTEKPNRPYIRNISIKDYYIDPGCEAPSIQAARFDCVRKLMTVDDLKQYRNQTGFNIPSDEWLLEAAKSKTETQGDNSKRAIESYLGGIWEPHRDSTADPAGKRVEVVQYTTKDRIVWALNRTHCAYNKVNPLGFIPRFSFYYTDVPDRWHALGICDVVEGEQRLQEEIINGRIDLLALLLNPSTKKRRGARLPQSMFRRRPGNVMEMDDPDKDLVREDMSGTPIEAQVEVAASDIRAQKITGITDLAALGVGGPGSSVGRTATGVNTVTAASGRRLQYLVENDEDEIIEPFLEAWHTLNQKYLDPERVLEWVGENGKLIRLDPLVVRNAAPKFSMRASAKMQSRQFLIQVFPLVSQTLLAPQFMDSLARLYGKKVNVEEIGQMLWDFSGYRQKAGPLFLPLSQQEQAALNQPPPADMLRMQMQRERIAGQQDIAQEKHAADMMEKVIAPRIADEISGASESEAAD